jgi:hypothetical protein
MLSVRLLSVEIAAFEITYPVDERVCKERLLY